MASETVLLADRGQLFLFRADPPDSVSFGGGAALSYDSLDHGAGQPDRPFPDDSGGDGGTLGRSFAGRFCRRDGYPSYRRRTSPFARNQSLPISSFPFSPFLGFGRHGRFNLRTDRLCRTDRAAFARRWVGRVHRRLIPASLLFGSLFLALCYTAARTVLYPDILPVGDYLITGGRSSSGS